MIDEIIVLSNNDNEELISILIQKTKREIESLLGYPYNDKLDNILVDMVVIKLNRLGTEGISSQSFNGVNESYLNEYPSYIQRQLQSFKKLKTL